MIADVLTEERISREALHAVMNGTLPILHKYKVWPVQAARSRAPGEPRLTHALRASRHFGSIGL
eukprot:923919-Lingulodinium_polyedra.AAC.1